MSFDPSQVSQLNQVNTPYASQNPNLATPTEEQIGMGAQPLTTAQSNQNNYPANQSTIAIQQMQLGGVLRFNPDTPYFIGNVYWLPDASTGGVQLYQVIQNFAVGDNPSGSDPNYAFPFNAKQPAGILTEGKDFYCGIQSLATGDANFPNITVAKADSRYAVLNGQTIGIGAYPSFCNFIANNISDYAGGFTVVKNTSDIIIGIKLTAYGLYNPSVACSTGSPQIGSSQVGSTLLNQTAASEFVGEDGEISGTLNADISNASNNIVTPQGYTIVNGGSGPFGTLFISGNFTPEGSVSTTITNNTPTNTSQNIPAGMNVLKTIYIGSIGE